MLPGACAPASTPLAPSTTPSVEFWSFLDGYLSAPETGTLESKPLSQPGEKRRPDPVAAPVAVPVAWPAPVETPALEITLDLPVDGAPALDPPAAKLSDPPPDAPPEPVFATPQPVAWLAPPAPAPAPHPVAPDPVLAPLLDRQMADPAVPVAAGHQLAFGARLVPDPPPDRPLTAGPNAPIAPEQPPSTAPAAVPAAEVPTPEPAVRKPDEPAAPPPRKPAPLAAPENQKASSPAIHAPDIVAKAAAPHPVQTAIAEAPPAPATRESMPTHQDRLPEPVRTPEIQEPPAEPVSRDISLRWSEGPGSVDIRMAEHAGEIRVTVHTPSHDLAHSLRAGLPDLVGKLRQNGYQTETWQGGDHPEGFSDPGSSRHHPRDGGAQDRQPPHPRKDPAAWDGAWNATFDPSEENQL